MSEQNGLVELRFTEPAGLLGGEEDLDGDVLSAPFAFPYLAVPTFTNAFCQVDLLGYSSLNLNNNKRTY